MATIRALSVALLLALCLAACAFACAAGEAREPTNRYISYTPVRDPRSGNDGGPRRGCWVLDPKCPDSHRVRGPPTAGATTATAAVSQTQGGLAASQTASTKGGAKAFAAGRPKVDYCKAMMQCQLSTVRDKLCGRFGCPNFQPPVGP